MDGDGFSIETANVPMIVENKTPIAVLRKLNRYPAEICNWLDRAKLLNGYTSVVNKVKLPKVLLYQGLGEYTIPTEKVVTFSSIEKTLQIYSNCVLKPKAGSKGRGLFYLEYVDGVVHYSNASSNGVLRVENWDGFMQDNCCKSWIIQPCLDFHTASGQALDFRLLTSKGRGGKWEPAAIHAMIGSTRYVSNGAQGGAGTLAEPVLFREFPETAEALIKDMIRLCSAVPEAIAVFSEQEISFYGIDIGVDRKTKKIYVIEANLEPGVDYTPWHLAEKRVRYWRHVLDRPVKDSSEYSPLISSLQ